MADEFDDFFDDEPLDEEFEESLAQVEATYTASQAAHIPPSRPLGKGAESSYARGQPAHSNGRGGGGGPAVGRNGRIGGNDRFSAPPRQPAQQSFRPPLKRPRLGESPAASNASWAAPIVIDDDEESAPAVVLGDDGKMMVDYGAGQPPSAAVTGRTPVATSQPGADEVIVKNLGADPYDNDDTFWASEGIQEAEEEAVRMSQQLRTAPNQGRQAVSGPVSGRSPQRAARRAETGYQEGPSAQPDTELNARVKSLQEQVAKLTRAQEERDAEFRRLKNEKRAKEGEVTVVRSNLAKTNAELAGLQQKLKAREDELKKEIERIRAEATEQMERQKSDMAFRRVEMETSRKPAWPSTVRRRPAPNLRPHSSQSQSVAGLTTPTRRSNAVNGDVTPTRSGGSRSGGSSGRFGISADPQQSPSRGRGTSLAQEENDLRFSRKLKSAVKTFPKFNNSFAADSFPRRRPAGASPQSRPGEIAASQTRTPEHRDEHGASPTVAMDADGLDGDGPNDILMMDDMPGPSTRLELRPQQDVSLWDNGRTRLTWAVRELARRRTDFVGDVLSHTSEPPSSPLSLPASRFNATAVPEPVPVPAHPSTLQRLLNAPLPADTNLIIRHRYTMATEQLLVVLTRGSVSDGETRFAYLLNEKENWESDMTEGLADLHEGIAHILRVLLGLFLSLYMVDSLRDVFLLVNSLSLAHRDFVGCLLSADTSTPYFEAEPSSSADPISSTLDTPTNLMDILLEAIRRCNALPVNSSASEMLPPAGSQAGEARAAVPASQKRRNKAKGKGENETRADTWDMGDDARDELLDATLGTLEVLAWELGDNSIFRIRQLFEHPGLVFTFLDSTSPSDIMQRMIRVLTLVAGHANMFRALLACKYDPLLQTRVPAKLAQSPVPILELLSRHLVDRRTDMPPLEMHDLHHAIITFLSQLVIKHEDAFTLVADSRSVVPALVTCLNLDTGMIWNDDGFGIDGVEVKFEHVIARICMDIRLLSHLYTYPERPPSLAKKLSDAQADLNGIRHMFTVSVARVAFAEEPEWVAQRFGRDSAKPLDNLMDVAGDLLDLVLSPDEVDQIYDLLSPDSEEDGQSDTRPDESAPSEPILADDDEEMAAGDAMN